MPDMAYDRALLSCTKTLRSKSAPALCGSLPHLTFPRTHAALTLPTSRHGPADVLTDEVVDRRPSNAFPAHHLPVTMTFGFRRSSSPPVSSTGAKVSMLTGLSRVLMPAPAARRSGSTPGRRNRAHQSAVSELPRWLNDTLGSATWFNRIKAAVIWKA